MKPMVLRRSDVSARSESREVSLPAIATLPDEGVSTHPMRLSRVVFPEPEGPAMERNSPSSTSSDTPRSAGTETFPSA